jgi:hypothetical protein
MMNNDRSLLASLLSALFFFPLGMILGVLSFREYERVKTEEMAYKSQMDSPLGSAVIEADSIDTGGVPAPPPSPPDLDPIDLQCDLCGKEFSVPGDTIGEVDCPKCDNDMRI